MSAAIRAGAFLKGLNRAQREAVTTTSGPLLVLAGAGTGKTRVITTRIAYLLSRGVAPENVLAVTFTNKAAGEMKERVAAIIGRRAARELTVGTFHSFCVRALKEHGEALGISRTFTICDSSDQLAAVKSVMRELRYHESAMHPQSVLARISLLKNRLESPASLLEQSEQDQNDLVASVWQRYQEHLGRSRTLDFDDLLLKTLELLRSRPKVKSQFRKRYLHVLVDEYQDTNGPQYEIVRQIGGAHRNICVVGDDDQSIYGWRGADIQKILNFHRDFKGAKVVRLLTNYRSTTPILEAANSVIQHNSSRHEKTLSSAVGQGAPVRLTRLRDEMTEARYVVEEIRSWVRRGEAKLVDCAILFRTQVQPRAFEAELRAEGIPYVLVGGMSFFDRKEVRDILAFLRLAVNGKDETAFLRIVNTPPRGIGKTTLDRVLAFATEEGISAPEAFERGREIEGLSPAALEAYGKLKQQLERSRIRDDGLDLVKRIKDLLDLVGYKNEVRRLYADPMTREARWAAVEEVWNFAENHSRKNRAPSLAGFLDEMALNSGDDPTKPEDRKDRKEEAVTLMTLHAAKGLEFRYVFLVGMEEGLLPHARSVQDGGVEEERRLCYVGMTRAMRLLSLSFVEERARYGRRAAAMPSRFLFEMRGKTPPEDWTPVEQWQEGDSEKAAARKKSTRKKKKRRASKGRKKAATRGRAATPRP